METTDVLLRGPVVNMRKHWDGEHWMLEDPDSRETLLIGTKEQIMDEYDKRNAEAQEQPVTRRRRGAR